MDRKQLKQLIKEELVKVLKEGVQEPGAEQSLETGHLDAQELQRANALLKELTAIESVDALLANQHGGRGYVPTIKARDDAHKELRALLIKAGVKVWPSEQDYAQKRVVEQEKKPNAMDPAEDKDFLDHLDSLQNKKPSGPPPIDKGKELAKKVKLVP